MVTQRTAQKVSNGRMHAAVQRKGADATTRLVCQKCGEEFDIRGVHSCNKNAVWHMSEYSFGVCPGRETVQTAREYGYPRSAKLLLITAGIIAVIVFVVTVMVLAS